MTDQEKEKVSRAKRNLQEVFAKQTPAEIAAVLTRILDDLRENPPDDDWGPEAQAVYKGVSFRGAR